MSSQATATEFEGLDEALVAVREQRMSAPRVAIVDLSGDVDLYSFMDVRETVLHALDDPSVGRVIVNFRAVKGLDSSGVATLVECLHRSRQTHRRLSLCGLNEAPRRVLELTRLMNSFEVFGNLDAALAG